MAEIWLNIPQAVVLEATGDLKRARGLKERDPQLLVVKTALLLPPLGRVPIEPDASDEEMRLALRRIREEIEPRSSERSYAVSLRRIHAKLLDGVTAKGRRAPNLPLEVIDPAEFVCLELDDLNAVDPRTGETIFYDLLVCARGPDSGGRRSLPAPCSSLAHIPHCARRSTPHRARRGRTCGQSARPAPCHAEAARRSRSAAVKSPARSQRGRRGCSGSVDRRSGLRSCQNRILTIYLGEVYGASRRAGPGNDINAGSPGSHKAPT